MTSLTVGDGAVRFPIDAGGALKDVIEAPSLDVVRALDARTNIGSAVEAGAPSDTEPEVHEDYFSAYDLGRFAESARFVRHYPEQNPVLRELLTTITTPQARRVESPLPLAPESPNTTTCQVRPAATELLVEFALNPDAATIPMTTTRHSHTPLSSHTETMTPQKQLFQPCEQPSRPRSASVRRP